VGYNLRALKSAASAVRERLSQEQWHMIVRTEADFFQRCAVFSSVGQSQSQSQGGQGQSQSASSSPPSQSLLEYSSVEALRALESASGFLSAMTGAQTDRMTRDDGWRLLSVGRLIERLNTLAGALVRGFETGSIFEEGGFNAMVALFDSTITFHAQYQQRRDIPALLDLLVLDRDNPRSLGWVVQTLRGRLAKLAGSAPGDMPDLAMELPDPGSWALADLCAGAPGGSHDDGIEREDGDTEEEGAEGRNYQDDQDARLVDLLQQCCDAALELSDTLSRRYFSHAASGSQSLGA